MSKEFPKEKLKAGALLWLPDSFLSLNWEVIHKGEVKTAPYLWLPVFYFLALQYVVSESEEVEAGKTIV